MAKRRAEYTCSSAASAVASLRGAWPSRQVALVRQKDVRFLWSTPPTRDERSKGQAPPRDRNQGEAVASYALGTSLFAGGQPILPAANGQAGQAPCDARAGKLAPGALREDTTSGRNVALVEGDAVYDQAEPEELARAGRRKLMNGVGAEQPVGQNRRRSYMLI